MIDLRAVLVAIGLLVGCSGPRSANEIPASDTPTAAPAPEQIGDAPVPTAPGTPVSGEGLPSEGGPVPTDTPVSPASLYEGCRDRVEGLQAAGECVTDADCAKAGCSQEVCVAAKNAGDVMSTCEVLPCFRALDACGCHEGMCTWTVAADTTAPGKLPLPAK